MSEDQKNWCTCQKHNSKNWQTIAGHYCRHFVPSTWSLEYHSLECHEDGRALYIIGACDICGGFMRSGTNIPAYVQGGQLLAYIYRKMTHFRPYDGYDKKEGYYNGAVPKRAKWYQEQDELPEIEADQQFVGLFHENHQVWEWLDHNRPRPPYTKPSRDRKSTLFQKMLEMARADGGMAEMDAILDYVHSAECTSVKGRTDTCLTDYRFDIVPQLIFGTNEGIYLTLFLEGTFDSSGSRRTLLGTLKTLHTDKESCRLMGALGGILMYCGRRYIEQEIDRYTPEPELADELKRQGEQCGQ